MPTDHGPSHSLISQLVSEWSVLISTRYVRVNSPSREIEHAQSPRGEAMRTPRYIRIRNKKSRSVRQNGAEFRK
jgi:hypothetical protein